MGKKSLVILKRVIKFVVIAICEKIKKSVNMSGK